MEAPAQLHQKPASAAARALQTPRAAWLGTGGGDIQGDIDAIQALANARQKHAAWPRLRLDGLALLQMPNCLWVSGWFPVLLISAIFGGFPSA